jgi:hypothetical protein
MVHWRPAARQESPLGGELAGCRRVETRSRDWGRWLWVPPWQRPASEGQSLPSGRHVEDVRSEQ